MPISRPAAVRRAALTLLPFAFLQGLWFLNGQAFEPQQSLFAYGTGLGLLCAFWALNPSPRCLARRTAPLVLLWTALCGLWAWAAPSQPWAWGLALAGLSAHVFGLVNAFSRAGWLRWLMAAACALGLALLGAGAVQLAERFAEEEFFAGVQVIFLAGWLLLAWAAGQWGLLQAGPGDGLPLPAWLPSVPILAAAGFGVLLFRAYQASFYPAGAPQYAGISAESPFLCGEAGRADSTVYQGTDVYRRIVQKVAGNDQKTTAELGMLAMLTGEERWRQEFRDELLQEVRAGQYTGPANSVKYGQYEVAQRLYYYARIQEQAPLFSAPEQAEVRAWLAAVNRRALTVEWVDWMYATAFSEWPSGPYLNQDIGAGLLSLLQATGYEDPALAGQNRAFLDAHPVGWQKGFRNTDDALAYQTVWNNNALFQSLAQPEMLEDDQVIRRRQLAFDWLLAQARPDGSLVGYNPNIYSLAGTVYQGAELLADARLLWLAGRSLDYLDQTGGYLWSQPGITGPLAIEGAAPTVASCLIYSDSGLPNQSGPLAPDKVVLRGGWQPDDPYLMLNLRFAGWHRYKATNAIISIYQQEPWIVENTSGSAFAWLPVGRAAFRDKRIPRENLNGLVIEKRGISQAIYWLTGFGSRWAQDVPGYASVEQFAPDGEVAESVTVIEDWHGWTHRRKISFVQDGPIVVFDRAGGPPGVQVGITWQASAPESSQAAPERSQAAPESSQAAPGVAGAMPLESGQRVPLGASGNAEMALVFSGGSAQAAPAGAGAIRQVMYTAGDQGELKLVTVFLGPAWAGASVEMLDDERMTVIIRLSGQEITLSMD